MDQIDGFAVSLLSNKGYIALHMDASRAGMRTGRFAYFVNRNASRLTIKINCFMTGARQSHRAGLDAIPAGGAFGQIDITRMLAQLNLEIVCSPSHLRQAGYSS